MTTTPGFRDTVASIESELKSGDADFAACAERLTAVGSAITAAVEVEAMMLEAEEPNAA